MDQDPSSPVTVQSGPLKYRPLTDSTKDFRFVVLHPAVDYSTDLHCEVDHFTLDAKPEYEALSYVWGTLRADKPIYVRHATPDALSSIPVWSTANLEAALRALRLHDRPRTIWVDSLCIDQSNMLERADQVRLMGRIYQTCSRDLLWLGTDVAVVSTATAIMHRLRTATNDQSVLLHLTTDEWSALEATFGTNAVWQRVWIVQELHFAPKILLFCHGHTLEWTIIEEVLDDNVEVKDIFLNQQGTLLFEKWFRCFVHLSRFRTMRHETTTNKRLFKKTLMSVVSTFSELESTFPHDRVYGLLNLADDTGDFPVDYTLSLDELSVAFTRHVLGHDKSMLALSAALGDPLTNQHGAEEGSFGRTLPSWVIDLSQQIPGVTGLTWLGHTHFNACGFMTNSVAVFSPDSKVLSTGGWVIDKVGAMYPRTAVLSDENSRAGWIRDVHRWGASLSSQRICSHGLRVETELNAFCRTIVTDRVLDKRIGPTDPAYLGMDPMNLRTVPQEQTVIPGWHFSTTSGGIYCMLPPAAREGDLIVVLLGSKIPYLLRPLGPFSDGMKEVDCRLVGEAYVHGYMDGESALSLATSFKDAGGFRSDDAHALMHDLLLRFHIH